MIPTAMAIQEIQMRGQSKWRRRQKEWRRSEKCKCTLEHVVMKIVVCTTLLKNILQTP
jgi:hypothetical protein